MTIEHSILGVIASRPCTGYDIKTELEHEGAGRVMVSFESVYPKLKSFEEQGLIQTYRPDTKGRQKKMYELTKNGGKLTTSGEVNLQTIRLSRMNCILNYPCGTEDAQKIDKR
jgi:DNA-binding PadR family transcriptional regulator